MRAPAAARIERPRFAISAVIAVTPPAPKRLASIEIDVKACLEERLEARMLDEARLGQRLTHMQLGKAEQNGKLGPGQPLLRIHACLQRLRVG